MQMVDLDMLVTEGHLLRKIDKLIDFDRIYDLVEHLYCADKDRPATDPVVLFKIVFIQHLFSIRFLRQTVAEVDSI